MALDTREAVQALGEKVRAARAGGYFGTLNSMLVDEAHNKGFVEGVAQLAALVVEIVDNEPLRREFLADLGFDGEEIIG